MQRNLKELKFNYTPAFCKSTESSKKHFPLKNLQKVNAESTRHETKRKHETEKMRFPIWPNELP